VFLCSSHIALVEKRKNIIIGYLRYGSKPTSIVKHYGYSKDCVHYWVEKFLNPGFHPNNHGGDKTSLFINVQQQLLMKEVVEYLQDNPTADLQAITQHLVNATHTPMSTITVGRMLKRHRWSWKVPTKFQIHKYSTANLLLYLNYLQFIQQVPSTKLKFANESHIISKDLSKSKVLGMRNVCLLKKKPSMMLMCLL